MTTPKRPYSGLQLRISQSEAVVLYAALRLVEAMSEGVPADVAPKPELVSRLTAKLRAQFKEKLLQSGDRLAAEMIEGMVPEVHITDLMDSDFSAPMYDVAQRLPHLQAALAEHRAVAIEYYSLSREEITRRLVEPYALLQQEALHLLVGYCHWRDAVRVFRVDRIKTVTLTETAFTLPADFDPGAYFRR